MKKKIASILSITLLSSYISINSNNVFADNLTVESSVDGEVLNLHKIETRFNGNAIVSPFPAVLYSERTMVPVRSLAEAMGASVKWIHEDYSVDISLNNKKINLKIDSSDIKVNSLNKKIDYGIPPKLINGNTMVPLRFISEELGCKVDWKKDFSVDVTSSTTQSKPSMLTDIITSVANNTIDSIDLISNDLSSSSIYMYSEKDNIVAIDIPNGSINIDGKSSYNKNINISPVRSISASIVENNVNRILIELDKDAVYSPLLTKTGMNISFSNPKNRLENINTEKIDGKDAIVLKNIMLPEIKDFKLSGNPNKIVLDLKNTKLNVGNLDISTDLVNAVRTSQYSNPAEYDDTDTVTRVVIDLKSHVSNYSYNIDKSNNDIIIYVDSIEDEDNLGGNTGGHVGTGDTSYTNYNMTIDQMLSAQFSKLTTTDKYGKSPAYVYSGDVKNNVIVSDKANVHSDTNGLSFIYGVLPKNTKVTILESSGDWHKIYYGNWRNAPQEDILHYLDLNNIKEGTAGYFQFLDLAKTSGISADDLNRNVLVNKGILSNTGNAFIEGGKQYGVNEIYLVSHAFLETGNGSSQLSNGVLVKQVDGVAVEPRVTYNMFGIGAVDSNALNGGAERAYKEGWFTPEEAIIGGAKFISEQYINRPNNNQNTLYKMRWNPDIKQVWHQYATDVAWANKQVTNIKKLYDLCESYTLFYDVPVYQQ